MRHLTSAMYATAAAAMACAPASAQVGPAGSDACSLQIATGATNWIIRGYDPFGTSVPIATFDVTYSNEGSGTCEFHPVFVLDQEAFGLATVGRQIRATYTLLEQFSNSNATPLSGRTIARATQRKVVVQPKSQQLVRFQFAVDEDALTADGLYSQRVTLIAEGAQNAMLASRSLVLGVEVLPSAVMALSGAYRRDGGQALVDLGELREGVAQVPLQLRVSSTRAYRLEFSSRNGGRLVAADPNWSVPYALGVGERTLALSSVAGFTSTNPDPATDSLPLQFVIGDVSGKRAGLYSDLLTITVSAK